MRAFVQLEFMRVQKTIINWYEIQKNLFLEVIQQFIQKSILNGSLGYFVVIKTCINNKLSISSNLAGTIFYKCH